MAKVLSEIHDIQPTKGNDGNYSFKVTLTSDRSDFTSQAYEVVVTVTADELLDFYGVQKTVLRQSGMLLRVAGADDSRTTWFDRVQKHLKNPS